MDAEETFDRIVAAMIQAAPQVGLSAQVVRAWAFRVRGWAVPWLAEEIRKRGPRERSEGPPEEWTAARRTKANLDAMRLAASKHPSEMSDEDRRVLAGYSGWGGLSIEGASETFPAGFPVPEERGLIHEYYTPTKVCSEVARIVRPLLEGLGSRVLAIEPSAGIGRFIRAFSGPGFEAIEWMAVEYSALSARMLAAIRSDLALTEGSFEEWNREHFSDYVGRIQLVVSNPPYGARGASVADDPDRSYREKQAYAYFMRRGLDLLGKGGLGVFLVPTGWLTGTAARNVDLRRRVLLRHHLAGAFRLPSKLFPGALLPTDLLFFRSRGGTLSEVDAGDAEVMAGRYFKAFPSNILGKEVGNDVGEDDQTGPKKRWGYQVEGTFDRLPPLVERPMCGECVLSAVEVAVGKGRVGVARSALSTEGLPEALETAVLLGARADSYLALLADTSSQEPVLLHRDLVEGLRAWGARNGNPWANPDLQRLSARSDQAARFLAVHDKAGRLLPAILSEPTWSPRYTGGLWDSVAQAESIYRRKHHVSVDDVAEMQRGLAGPDDSDKLGGRSQRIERELIAAGWCEVSYIGPWEPPADYYTGDLWEKWEAVKDSTEAHHIEQARRLLETIAPVVYEDITGVSPRASWAPLHLIQQWLSEEVNGGWGGVRLTRKDGLVQVEGKSYEELDGDGELYSETVWCVGWMNHDKTLFSPKKKKDENIDEVRLKWAAEWSEKFSSWVGSDEGRKAEVTEAYNRQMLGYVAPTYSPEPIPIARWRKDGPRLHAHQLAGAQRLLANHGGLLAFDVGVGKTYTGIATLARARQEGWARRPVVLVPNSIVWKWHADFARVLPDFRVAVVGSTKKVISRGPRKGMLTSETDTVGEQAEKWTRFQAGEFDVVLLTYSALPRTRMNEDAIRKYADHTEAIQREVKLRQRNAAETKKPTERQVAILKEGVAAWIAEVMEIPAGWEYVPGIAWDDIGIDFLMVDEAQNYKNLYLPESREGGVPRFMGNAGEGSDRAWQLDFRAAAVRARTGGSGVVLLSATPAKNSPLEFYNLIQYVDHEAWSRKGIHDPEQFIDRYMRIEMKTVLNTKMEVEERSAVTGFTNLDELRATIFRYGEFKTAEQVGLKLPTPTVNLVQVDMDARQEDKYLGYVAKVEAALSSSRKDDKGAILGLLARMAMVAVHADLDGGYDWKTAQAYEGDPGSSKFHALAKRVAGNKTCGHIVFVENIAAHVWIRETLVRSGIALERIAILNGVTAKAAADRQRIALEFNGDPEEGIPPAYDVVIANQIAYEGIDLQTRTCAIHHIDLSWEPATLQQRNGRGVRQGNTLAAIEINYYFAKRSQDGMRFNLIQGKLGWMTMLLNSQARDTNNPGAQMDLGPEEILLLISRDPAKTEERLAKVKAQRQAEARQKVANDANMLLRGANARFRKSERSQEPSEAARLRLEAEARLDDLARVDAEAWPWAQWAFHARTHELLIPSEGKAPVWAGLRLGLPSPYNPERLDYVHFGRVVKGGTAIGLREAGSFAWSSKGMEEVGNLNIAPTSLVSDWPDDWTETLTSMDRTVRTAVKYGGFIASHLALAPDDWTSNLWSRAAATILRAMSEIQSWSTTHQKVPTVKAGMLKLAQGYAIQNADVIPPTDAGWEEFLRLAPATGWKWAEINDVAGYWWDRRIPQALLSSGNVPPGGAS